MTFLLFVVATTAALLLYRLSRRIAEWAKTLTRRQRRVLTASYASLAIAAFVIAVAYPAFTPDRGFVLGWLVGGVVLPTAIELTSMAQRRARRHPAQ